MATQSKYDRLGFTGARAELRVAQRLGVLIGFSHRSQPEFAIYATLLQQDVGSETAITNRQKEFYKGTFLIPVQNDAVTNAVAIYPTDGTAIAPENKPITVGDRIQWPANSGRFYYINEDVKTNDNGYTYICSAEACRPLTLGQRS